MLGLYYSNSGGKERLMVKLRILLDIILYVVALLLLN